MEEEQRSGSAAAAVDSESVESAGGAAESAGGAAESAGGADEAADGGGALRRPRVIWEDDLGEEVAWCWLIDRDRSCGRGTAIAAKARELPPPTIIGTALERMGAALDRRVCDPPLRPPPPPLPPGPPHARTSSDVISIALWNWCFLMCKWLSRN
jgi:hypothetical protein